MTFALDLNNFAQKAGKRADDACGRIVTAVVGEVDARSPVGDARYWKRKPPKGYVGGHFRGNWQLGIDVFPRGELPGADPTGSGTVTRNIAAIPEEAAGPVYTLANNVPYALRIENGWSHQAPQGVVGLTVEKFQQIVNQAASATGAQA